MLPGPSARVFWDEPKGSKTLIPAIAGRSACATRIGSACLTRIGNQWAHDGSMSLRLTVIGNHPMAATHPKDTTYFYTSITAYRSSKRNGTNQNNIYDHANTTQLQNNDHNNPTSPATPSQPTTTPKSTQNRCNPHSKEFTHPPDA